MTTDLTDVITLKDLGPVVQKPINANPGLRGNGIFISLDEKVL